MFMYIHVFKLKNIYLLNIEEEGKDEDEVKIGL